MEQAELIRRLSAVAALLTTVCLGPARPAAAADGSVHPANQGPLQWHRQLGSSGEDHATGVAADGAGNVYLIGWTTGALGGPYQGADDVWAAKYDAAGHQIWKRQLGTTKYDFATGVATDTDGNVYLTGGTYGALGGPNQGDGDAWLAKYDAAGHAVWKRQLGSKAEDAAAGVAVDGAGNVYLTGWTNGALGGPTQGSYDAWVAKYDAAGQRIWKRQLGSDTYDIAFGVATDADGNAYLTGYTYGALGGPFQGVSDAWVAKYDAAGHLLWTQHLGTPAYDIAYGVATDTAGNVFVTGATGGALGGPNQGYIDAWVAKYDGAGHLLWTQQLGTPGQDDAYGVATDAAGNVYLTGWTEGSLAGPRHGGVEDGWLAEYDSAGHLLWTQQLGTRKQDRARNVATFGTAGPSFVYVAGDTNGALCGTNRGSYDAFVAKYLAIP